MTDAPQKKHILIIEDDPLIQQMIVDKLTGEGYDVAACVMAEDGLAAMEKAKPDLLLLDLLLPQMDGFAVLEKMKADPRMKSIPVVILSNFGQQKDIDKGLGMGAVAYLIKANVNPRDVVEKVRTILGET
ncbi:response regulator [Candidatus Kaiserbacteria bacterium]|nr:response regulator [Candidatus Kaiserbacteria bacterium]